VSAYLNYLRMLSEVKGIEHQVIGQFVLMNRKGCEKKWFWLNLKYHLWIFMEALKKSRKTFGKKSPCLGLNPGPCTTVRDC
jgi:hypothetical protein